MQQAVFRKVITQPILCAIAMSGFLSASAEDEVMVVTANQMEQNINDTLTDVELISRDDIERIQPQSFIDLLINVAGIDVVQKGGRGQDA